MCWQWINKQSTLEKNLTKLGEEKWVLRLNWGLNNESRDYERKVINILKNVKNNMRRQKQLDISNAAF